MSCKCAACQCEIEEESNDLPTGWFMRVIDDSDYILCDVCGNARHFKGGVSAYLADCLSLDEDARCTNLTEADQYAAPRTRTRRAKRTKRQII